MRSSPRSSTESTFVGDIQAGDEEAFEEMFYEYYPQLCVFAAGYVDCYDRARGVVQDVFLRVWEQREDWEVEGELRTYLYQAVRNQSLNSIDRRDLIEELHPEHLRDHSPLKSYEQLYEKELATSIWSAIDRLPRRRRMAFVLHRQHGLSYEQVGQVMGITGKTVENQIGRALKFLRAALAPETK